MPWTGKCVTSVMTQLASAAFPVGALFSSPAPLPFASRTARTCDTLQGIYAAQDNDGCRAIRHLRALSFELLCLSFYMHQSSTREAHQTHRISRAAGNHEAMAHLLLSFKPKMLHVV